MLAYKNGQNKVPVLKDLNTLCGKIQTTCVCNISAKKVSKKGEENLATSRESQKNKESKVTRRFESKTSRQWWFHSYNGKLNLEGQESNGLN